MYLGGYVPDKTTPVSISIRVNSHDKKVCQRNNSHFTVYITGAALYPRCGSWNPTGPMVAMAMHLADMLSPPPPADKN